MSPIHHEGAAVGWIDEVKGRADVPDRFRSRACRSRGSQPPFQPDRGKLALKWVDSMPGSNAVRSTAASR